MLRGTPKNKFFHLCTDLIEEIIDYAEKTGNARASHVLRSISLDRAISSLFSGDLKHQLGALHYIRLSKLPKEEYQKLLIGDSTEKIAQTFLGVFRVLNRLPPDFKFDVQKKSEEMLTKILKLLFKFHQGTRGELIDKIRILYSQIAELFSVNNTNQQKLFIILVSFMLSKFTVPEINHIYTNSIYDEAGMELVSFEDVLKKEEGSENPSTLYRLMSLVNSTFENFRANFKLSRKISKHKGLSSKQILRYNSILLILEFLIKQNLPIRILSGHSFETFLERIIEALITIIEENEEFNQKIMESRGSNITIEQNMTIMESEAGQKLNRKKIEYSVNKGIYFQDLEMDLNIDDYDFTIKNRSRLVKNAFKILASINTLPQVNKKKLELRKKLSMIKEKNMAVSGSDYKPKEDPEYRQLYEMSILRQRVKINKKFLENITRVESRIIGAVIDGLQKMLQQEERKKKFFEENEEEHVKYFNPILFTIQSIDINTMNVSYINSFEGLYHLFKSILHEDKLLDALIALVRKIEEKLNEGSTSLDYAVIKAIFRVLTLMLNREATNSNFDKKIRETQIEIIKKSLSLEQQFEAGPPSHSGYSIKKLIFNLMNNQTSHQELNILRKYIDNYEEYFFDFFLSLIKREESIIFRERLSRYNSAEHLVKISEKSMGQSNYENVEKFLRWSEVIIILAKRLPGWLIYNKVIFKIYHKNYLEQLKLQDELCSFPRLKNHRQFVLSLKILVLYNTHNKKDLSSIFDFLKVFKVKINEDIEFVKKFFKVTIPQKYSTAKQIELLKYFIKLLNPRDPNPDQEICRLANKYIVFPILYKLFKDKMDEHILSDQMIQIYDEKIDEIHESANCPGWIAVEFTLFIDYIISKTYYTNSNEKVNSFFENVLFFSWKNIVKPKGNDSLLKLLSKLVVSRLVVKFKKLYDRIGFIQQLAQSMVNFEEISTDDGKLIWIKVNENLLPVLKELNPMFVAQVKKPMTVKEKEEYWISDFMKYSVTIKYKGMDKDIQEFLQKYYTVLIKNSKLVENYKDIIISKDQIYENISHFQNYEKTPMIVLDLVHTLMNWYIKDYKKRKHAGQSLEGICNLDADRKRYILESLIKMIRKDDDNCGIFIQRVYFLIKKFLILFPDAKYKYEIVVKIFSPPRPDIMIILKLRLCFTLLNLGLCFLYHPFPDNSKEKFKDKKNKNHMIDEIFKFIFNNLKQNDSKHYTKFPYLIPLSYRILTRILEIKKKEDPADYIKKLEYLTLQSKDTIIYIITNYHSSEESKTNPRKDQEKVSLWIAIMLVKILYEENYQQISSFLKSVSSLLDIFLKYLNDKSDKEPNTEFEFDKNEDYLEKFFSCRNIESFESNNPSTRNFYKSYAILLLRVLLKFTGDPIHREKKELKIEPRIIEVLQNMKSTDFDLKIELLMQLKCIVLPHKITSKVYKPLATNIFRVEERIALFFKFETEFILRSKEVNNKSLKLFVEYYWAFLQEVLE